MSLLFLGQSCSLQFSQTEQTGLFKTVTGGRTWQQKSFLKLLNGETTRIQDIDATKIVVDHRSPQRVFLGTAKDGLFASENGAEEWVQLLTGQYVIDIAPDQSARCTLFAATPKTLLRTTNCSDSWDLVFRETRDNVIIRSIAVDYSESETVYMATSAGDIYKSFDGGLTWKIQYRNADLSFTQILIDRFDPTLIYIATVNGTILKSLDRGLTWEDITGNLKDFPDARSYRHIASISTRGSIFYVSDKGIFKTFDEGKTWQRVPFLTPESSAPIFVAGINERDSQEVFYGTRNTYYHTVDNGVHWFALPMPSGTVPSYLAVDPTNGAIQYLGFRKDRRRLEPYWYYGPEQYY